MDSALDSGAADLDVDVEGVDLDADGVELLLLTLMPMWRELSSARWWSSRESKPTVDRRAAAAPTSVSIHSCEQVNWEHKC